MIWLDKYGWPVESIRGRWLLNIIGRLLHVSVITSIRQRGRWQRTAGGRSLTDTWCRADYDVSCIEAAGEPK